MLKCISCVHVMYCINSVVFVFTLSLSILSFRYYKAVWRTQHLATSEGYFKSEMNSLIGKLVDFDLAVELGNSVPKGRNTSLTQTVNFIVSIDAKELQVTSQSTKSGPAKGQVVCTDC